MRYTVSIALLRRSTIQDEAAWAHEQRALDPAMPEHRTQGYDERREREFLAKRSFLAERAA